MSIKSEIRLVELQDVEIKNPNFLKNDNNWNGTGSTTWRQSNYVNAIYKVTGNTTQLTQELSLSGASISTVYIPGSKAFKLKYSIFNAGSGFTFTPYLNDVPGTTRVINGTYTDIFYISDSIVEDLLVINDNDDKFLINDNDDYLIWG